MFADPRRHRRLGVLLLGILGCAHSPQPTPAPAPNNVTATACALPAAAEILDQSATELHQVWDFAEDVRCLQPAQNEDPSPPLDPVLVAYQQAVRARTDVDPQALIRRQRGVFLASQNPALHAETRVSGPILDGSIGQIGPMSLLDMRLLTVQMQRHPMLTQPSEFTSFILRRQSPDGKRLRVYFSSFARSGGRMNHKVRERVDADLRAGYALIAHLHNHPFLFDRVAGDASWTRDDTKDDIAGALPPSVTDIQYYGGLLDEAALGGARVTNGFQTLVLSPKEIRALATRSKASP